MHSGLHITEHDTKEVCFHGITTDGNEKQSFHVCESAFRLLGDDGLADRALLDIPDIIQWADDVIA